MRKKPVEKPSDRDQDMEVARLRIVKRGIPPPKDAEALDRAVHRLDKKERKERKIASMTVPLDSLPDDPEVPDPAEAWRSLDEYRSLLSELDNRQAMVVDAMIRLGMTRTSIAQMLGISFRQVRRAHERAMNFLRSKLT